MATLVDIARHMLDYHARGDKLALAALKDAGTHPEHAEALTRAREIAAHTQIARRLWLDRLHAKPAGPIELFPDWPVERTIDEAAALNELWSAYLATLTRPDLDSEHRYTSTEGRTYASRTLDILTHVFGHTTYHRGQLALFVKAAGITPPGTDIITIAPPLPPAIVLGLIDHLRALERHEQEATARVLDSLGSVPPSEQLAPQAQRALGVMHHNNEVRHWWLHVLGGIPTSPGRDVLSPRPVAELAQYAASLHAAFDSFLRDVTPQHLASERTLTTPTGHAYTWNLTTVALHIYNHAAYHRGQIATLVTRSGGKRAITDYIFTTRREV